MNSGTAISVQAAAADGDAPQPVSFWQALRFWLKLGFISFGGPAGQIAIMHSELVERRRWISEQRFLHALNYCMLLPGPEAQQLATYIGWLMHRTWGGIVAGALFVLPSLFVLIALSWVYLRFGDVPLVAGIFYGIKPAVTARGAARRAPHRHAGAEEPLDVGHRCGVVRRHLCLRPAVPGDRAGGRPDRLLRRAALASSVRARRRPWRRSDRLRAGADRRRHADAGACAFLAPPPGRCSVVGLGLWGLAMAALVATLGLHGTLTQMGWFFTKAALLTFGGAYAVLPYVYQGAVETLPVAQRPADDRRSGAGRDHAGPADHGGGLRRLRRRLGASRCSAREALFLGGAVAATVVTFFTFLPSFVFILAGGPLVESTHGKLRFTAPLSAITAAVVGVILNLALFFAYHVLWPQGFGGRFDAVSALIAVAAAVALFRFKVGVMPLLGACAAVGSGSQPWPAPGCAERTAHGCTDASPALRPRGAARACRRG